MKKDKINSEAADEFNTKIRAALIEYKDKLNTRQMLAVASHFVGVLLYFQEGEDKAESREALIHMILKNIALGEEEATNIGNNVSIM